jgi:hypothetical protein
LNSENYDNYGFLLKWNYNLWMKQYLENIRTLNGLEAIGDITYVGNQELLDYSPGIREMSSSWRETGHYIRCIYNN